MEQPIDTVVRFCEAWERVDIDEILGFLAEGAVYHNIPLDPVFGHEAIRNTLAGFTAGVSRVQFEVLNIATVDSVVLTERIDRFFSEAKTIELPVMGTFEVADGKITAWRDYFDLNQFMTQLAG